MAPCATEPEPAGRFLPSGGMLMSALAISSGAAGRPNFGGATCAARATVAAMQKAALSKILDIDVAHLAVGADRPALNRVEMEILPRRILRHPFGMRLLHAALLVGRAAHQRPRSAAPHPRQPEAGQRLGQNRSAERSFGPALAAVRRNIDAAHAA